MFAFVKGEVADLMEGIVIVENNGIGYEILVPSDVVSEVTIGMDVKLHTYFHVNPQLCNTVLYIVFFPLINMKR